MRVIFIKDPFSVASSRTTSSTCSPCQKRSESALLSVARSSSTFRLCLARRSSSLTSSRRLSLVTSCLGLALETKRFAFSGGSLTSSSCLGLVTSFSGSKTLRIGLALEAELLHQHSNRIGSNFYFNQFTLSITFSN